MKAGNNPFWDIDPNLGNILDDDDNVQPSITPSSQPSAIEEEDDDTREPEIL